MAAGESLEEVIVNIREAARGWLEAAAEQNPPEADPDALVVELSLLTTWVRLGAVLAVKLVSPP